MTLDHQFIIRPDGPRQALEGEPLGRLLAAQRQGGGAIKAARRQNSASYCQTSHCQTEGRQAEGEQAEYP
ncbi:hypothetical protein VAWG006_17960 [Aeromonas enteropelogenes]|nr:hypothetical protein VAWG006_17960 [Aeromonas enteropelogenes]BEE21707.1 hypothetical protein VAWG007_18020 [Aeromonas enteropelogenes]